MTDDHDHDRSPADTSEEPEVRPGDWDPMAPETTVAEPGSEQAEREEEHQLQTGEENPT